MSAVRNAQRFDRDRRCPICDGCDDDARGGGRRCHGYMSPEGDYAHCSREEHAGDLPKERGDTFAHRLKGPCKCGKQHGAYEEKPNAWQILATYDYIDEGGDMLFQVVRYEGKQFRQRKPNGAGGWIWKLEDTRRVLYRLPELLAAPDGEIVFIAEGEKDVDNLRALGAIATCNPQGAGKWEHVDECAREALRGRRVVIVPDRDRPGRDHALDVARRLEGVAAEIRILELPPKKDVSDWIDLRNGLPELKLATADALEPAEYAASLRDDETGSDSDPVADPWKAELAKALADVKALLDVKHERKPLFTTDAIELLQRQFDGARWLVTGLVTRGGVVIIGGEPKAGIKTWQATELVVAIATGTKAFGEFYAEHGRCAYFYAEDLDVQVRNRVRALLAGAGRRIEAGRLHLQPRGTFIDVLVDDDLAWLVASVRQLGGIDVLVLDPLRDIHGGEEDKSDSMRNVMRRLRVLAEVLGCTVIVVHHAVKTTKDNAGRRAGQNLRGSSAIHGAMDCGLFVTDPDGNGINVFTGAVTSQVKGARSAGTFDLGLRVTDDSAGEAEKAEWTFARGESKSGPKDNNDASVLAFVRMLHTRGSTFNKSQLRSHPERPVKEDGKKISERHMSDALDRLVKSGALELHSGDYVPTEQAPHWSDASN